MSHEPADEPLRDSFCLVIGTAIGGADAVAELLAALPPKSDMAFVIIQSSGSDPLWPEALRNSTPLPISLVKEGSVVEEDLAAYVRLLEDDPAETAALYQDILIRVTGFFRDPQSFEGLRTRVFLPLCEMRSRKDPVRVWVPGCATGEEVYSIAIALVEYLGDGPTNTGIQLFGTDVSDAAIERARSGFYHKSLVEHLPRQLIERYFVPQDDHFRIAKSIRELCIFCTSGCDARSAFLAYGPGELSQSAHLPGCRGPAARDAGFPLFLADPGLSGAGAVRKRWNRNGPIRTVRQHHRFYRRKAMPPGAGLELAPGGVDVYRHSHNAPRGEDLIVEAESS